MKVAGIRLDRGEMSQDLKNIVDCLNRSYVRDFHRFGYCL